MAAGVGHEAGRPNGLLRVLVQLREAVHPAGGGPVGGGCVNNPGIGIFDEAHRLRRGGVRQAEKYQIGLVDEPSALLQILAFILADAQQLDIVPAAQAFIDLQAGCALLTVDVDDRFSHHVRSLTNCSMASICRSTASLAGPP